MNARDDPRMMRLVTGLGVRHDSSFTDARGVA